MSDLLQTNDHWVYFGDGNASQLIDSKIYEKQNNGIKYWKFILIPSKLVEREYDIESEQDPSSGMIVREYPAVDVISLQMSPHRSRIWVVCGFNGGKTPASRLNADFRETLLDDQRLLHSSASAKARLHQELEIERTQQTEALRLEVRKLLELGKATKRDYGEGEEEGSLTDPGEGA